jgi:hypothetical protein
LHAEKKLLAPEVQAENLVMLHLISQLKFAHDLKKIKFHRLFSILCATKSQHHFESFLLNQFQFSLFIYRCQVFQILQKKKNVSIVNFVRPEICFCNTAEVFNPRAKKTRKKYIESYFSKQSRFNINEK